MKVTLIISKDLIKILRKHQENQYLKIAWFITKRRFNEFKKTKQNNK